MNKKKRYLKRFTNWLFEEYKVPRIPVRIMYDYDSIIHNGSVCDGYFGDDNGETVILVAAKNLGLTRCMFVLAHEFVHYLQQCYGWDMTDTEIVENDAYFYQTPLVGIYLNNKKHLGEKINGVLAILPRNNGRD